MNALIIVDLQNDFLPGGALAVPEGELLVSVANTLMPMFDVVVATQDWHPPDHVSFAENHRHANVGDKIVVGGVEQILWPRHCVQNTAGAQLANNLDTMRISHCVLKGTHPARDSYSAFFDYGNRHSSGLAAYLHDREVDTVCVMGLTAEFCVKSTALDAKKLGFRTIVLPDGTRGLDEQPGDVDRAYADLVASAVRVIPSDQLAVVLKPLISMIGS